MIYIDLINNKNNINLQETLSFQGKHYTLETLVKFLDEINKEDITQQFLEELMPLLREYLKNNGYLGFIEKIDELGIKDKHVEVLSLIAVCSYDLVFMANCLLKYYYFQIPKSDIYEVNDLRSHLNTIKTAKEKLIEYELSIQKIKNILADDIQLEKRKMLISNELDYSEDYINHKIKYLEDKFISSIKVFDTFKNELEISKDFHLMKLNEFNKSKIISTIKVRDIAHKIKYMSKNKIVASTFSTLMIINTNTFKIIKQSNTYATLIISIDVTNNLIATTDLDYNLMLWDLNLNIMGKYKLDGVGVNVKILKNNNFAVTMNTGKVFIYNINPLKKIFNHLSDIALTNIILAPNVSVGIIERQYYFLQMGTLNENKTTYFLGEIYSDRKAIALSNGDLYLQKDKSKFIEKAHAYAIVSIKILENNVYTASADGIIKIWDLDSFDCIHTINIDSTIYCMDINYNYIAVSTSNQEIIIMERGIVND